MVKRESFKKKNESEGRLYGFHSPSKTALQQFVVEGGGEDYLDQLSLHAYQVFRACFLVYLWRLMLYLIM